MIECKNITKKWTKNKTEVFGLNDVSLKIEEGSFIAIKGPSGCGKSSLLLTIGGMIKPDSGTLTINQEDLYSKSQNERNSFRAKNVGFIFQAFHLIPYLSVIENILSASLVNKNATKERAESLMSKFNLTNRKNHNPSELSTGEKQRVALARAFLNEPKIILADEPTGNLDPSNAEIVLSFLQEYQKKNNATIILVSHQNDADKYAQHIIRMNQASITTS